MTFTASVSIQSHSDDIYNALGLLVESVPSVEEPVLVVAINSGPVSDYNRTVSDTLRVKPGDYIAGVRQHARLRTPRSPHNSTPKSDESHEDPPIDINVAFTVKRKLEFDVAVKKGLTSIGLELSYQEGTSTVLITGVQAGLISAWNEAHPDKAVKKFDRIVSANGISGSSEKLVKCLKLLDDLSIVIARPC